MNFDKLIKKISLDLSLSKPIKNLRIQNDEAKIKPILQKLR